MGEVVYGKFERPSTTDESRQAIADLLDHVAAHMNIDRSHLDAFGDVVVRLLNQIADDTGWSFQFERGLTKSQVDEIHSALVSVQLDRMRHCTQVLVLALPDLVRSIWGQPP